MRWLPYGEWYKLESVFASFGCKLPPDGHILVVEHEGEIVAFQCLHQIWHAGPVYIDPRFRGQGLWPMMQDKLEADAPSMGVDYYHQFGTPQNEQRLTDLGLESLGWTVWGKRLCHSAEHLPSQQLEQERSLVPLL